MIALKYKLFLICFCLLFFMYLVGCGEDEEEDAASLHLRIDLSPSIAAQAQQNETNFRVCIDDDCRVYEAAERQVEYSMPLDGCGRKEVRVEYLNSADRIISEGTTSIVADTKVLTEDLIVAPVNGT